MAKFKDRNNLFTGKLRVAPRPFVPDHWEVPLDYPSATRFWVDPESGATSDHPKGEHWTFSEQLRLWHTRQSGRVWASLRLMDRRGREEAEQSVKFLQLELKRNISTANAYLDLLVSIGYEACQLTRRAERAERALVSTTRGVHEISKFLRDAIAIDLAGEEAQQRAREAVEALNGLAASLHRTVSPVQRRFEPRLTSAVERFGRERDVGEWVRYTTPNRNFRKVDLNWLLASAIVTYRDNHPDATVDMACRRVSGYLDMLGAPLGSIADVR